MMTRIIRGELCPVCGNELAVNTFVSEFRCKYCKRSIKVNVFRKKGKHFVSLEEIVQNEYKKTPFIQGLEGR